MYQDNRFAVDGKRRDRLSSVALREAVRDIVALDRSGTLPDAHREIDLILAEERQARLRRTIGQELYIGTIASMAARLLGLPREECERAALDVLWPCNAQHAARVLRAWARDIGSRRAGA